MKIRSQLQPLRKGAVAVFLCFLMLPLLALLALSVDYGFLLYVRTDLQRTADQAAIAGIRDILPDAYGNQDFAQARTTIRDYVAKNLGDGFQVLDSDIEFGRFDKDEIYDSVVLQDSGIFDTVRISIRNDEFANNSISLYFARLFGSDESDISVTSTAILQPARYLGPGTAILPIAMEDDVWNALDRGDAASIYGDGRIENELGDPIPGNWGTVDIGASSNSAADLNRQIEEGLSQSDLDTLYQQKVIDQPEYIDSQIEITVNGDTGFSAGIKSAIQEIEGKLAWSPSTKKSLAREEMFTSTLSGGVPWRSSTHAGTVVKTPTFRFAKPIFTTNICFLSTT